MTTRIVLASASPRRRELLREAGLEFEVAPVEVDEALDAFRSPDAAALELARRKARASALRVAGENAIVVGADTIVALEQPGAWRLLGKPVDEDDERAMLHELSGSRHAVVTGVCVVASRAKLELAECERTWVVMRAIEPAEIEAYVASGEWRDKAGGYAIQENADRFVVRLEGGGFDNVVGLPVGLTLRLIAHARRRIAGE
jgi:septum formation protein